MMPVSPGRRAPSASAAIASWLIPFLAPPDATPWVFPVRTCYGRLSAGRRSRARSARIKEGKGAIKWTRLSCRTFAANAVRLQLHALAYNLANFMRALAMPKTAEPWSLTSLREKLIKIGAKVVRHGRYVTFQMAEVAVSHQMFNEILSQIARLRAPPAPA